MGHEVNYSDDMAAAIDDEIRALLDDAHHEAREILTLHRATLDRLADALVDRETLSDADLAPIWDELDLPGNDRSGNGADSRRATHPNRDEPESRRMEGRGSEIGPRT